MEKTTQQYDKVIEVCQKLFENKMKDYGAAWRILRLSSLTDQIYIKAKRIRSLQENSVQMIDENESDEFIGIINYSIMALIQLEKGVVSQPDMNAHDALENYKKQISVAKSLMQKKNHDYGEAWRDLRISSITDLILQKILRIKQIEDNSGKTIVSEGLDANYLDIINYAVFSLILIKENS